MSVLSLDTIANSATYFAGQWTPALKLNQSRDLLRLVLSKMYFPSQGNLFHARIRASHSALADALDLSREWICKLTRKLRDAKWIETSAPRRAGSNQQEITVFRPGKRLKRLLVMLLKSKQRAKPSVNTPSQFFPSSQKQEQKQTDRQTDKPIPSGWVEGVVGGLAEQMSLLKKTRW
jgi:hypothetical protein